MVKKYNAEYLRLHNNLSATAHLDEPPVTILIPVLNPRIDWFEEALSSIVAQTYSNWKLLSVNDGCTSVSRSELQKLLENKPDTYPRLGLLNFQKIAAWLKRQMKGFGIAKRNWSHCWAPMTGCVLSGWRDK